MLVLKRGLNQKIHIGGDVVVTVVGVASNGAVRLGIEAPKDVLIVRDEVLRRAVRKALSEEEKPDE